MGDEDDGRALGAGQAAEELPLRPTTAATLPSATVIVTPFTAVTVPSPERNDFVTSFASSTVTRSGGLQLG